VVHKTDRGRDGLKGEGIQTLAVANADLQGKGWGGGKLIGQEHRGISQIKHNPGFRGQRTYTSGGTKGFHGTSKREFWMAITGDTWGGHSQKKHFERRKDAGLKKGKEGETGYSNCQKRKKHSVSEWGIGPDQNYLKILKGSSSSGGGSRGIREKKECVEPDGTVPWCQGSSTTRSH